MNLKMDVFKFVENYVNKRNKMYNTDSKVYDPPVWQYLVKSEVKTHIRDEDGVPDMVFIYFTTREEGKDYEYTKRYHQLVVGCLGIDIYYEDENIIDRNNNYPISDVKRKFTNWCRHMLEQMEPTEKEPN